MNVIFLCFLSAFIISCSSNNAANVNHEKVTSNASNEDDDKDEKEADDENGKDEIDEKKIDISQLPESIIQYITTNYADATIIEAEVSNTNYEVELSNNVELVFDKEGNFKKIEREEDDKKDNDDDK